MKHPRYAVMLAPLLLLVAGAIMSGVAGDWFISIQQQLVDQLTSRLDWLFNWSTFLFVLLVTAIYLSPLGKQRIGGEAAKPILPKWRWFAITLCTTIATGILFWGTAEPIFHLRDYPLDGPADPAFAMSTLFLHWTIVPYAIYTVAGLAFALAFYNRNQPFSLAAMLYGLCKKPIGPRVAAIVDSICLYGLVAGMAASLGAGVLTLSGGIQKFWPDFSGPLAFGLICLGIVLAFVVSANSGLQRGIKWLSGFNFIGFCALALLVLAFGPVREIGTLAWEGLIDFGQNFFPRSTNINNPITKDWRQDWTTFYWANWFAWAPVSALFLGRLSVGYTVREFIQINWLWTSFFGALWMIIFGGSAITEDVNSGGSFQALLGDQGPESIIYALLAELPLATSLVSFFLLLVFLSYVTAADSNISAMSALSVKGIRPDNPEAPLWIKIVWGSAIGLISWVMISTAGIDGIRLISILGGLPAMLLICLVAIGLVRTMLNR